MPMVARESVQTPERRSKPRSLVSVPMSLFGRGHRLLLRARTVDLSASGAMVHGAGPLRVGQSVSIEVQRGQARNPLTLQAEVVRIATPSERRRQHGVAVRFVEVSELDETIIESIIAAAKH